MFVLLPPHFIVLCYFFKQNLEKKAFIIGLESHATALTNMAAGYIYEAVVSTNLLFHALDLPEYLILFDVPECIHNRRSCTMVRADVLL